MQKIKFITQLVAAICAGSSAVAQSYSIGWYKVAGGGGASTGTNGGHVYAVSGSIRQQDTGAAMTGGSYSLTGGFWSLIAVLPSPGGPNLTITRAGNSVIVSWRDTGNYILQQNSNLAAPAGWITSSYAITTKANGADTITITPPTGDLFFRLANP
jgi:hypothetical protein